MEDNRLTSDRVRYSLLIVKYAVYEIMSAFCLPREKDWKSAAHYREILLLF